MRNKKTLRLLFIISLTLILISCSSEEDIIENNKDQGDEKEGDDVKIINIGEERSDEQEEIGEIDGMDEIEKIEDFEEVLQNNKTGIEDII